MPYLISILSVLLASLVFALAISLGGFGLCWLIWEMTPAPFHEWQGRAEREFHAFLSMIYTLGFCFVLGAIVGVIYALMPKRTRDPTMAAALGAGAALLVSIGAPLALIWEAAAVVLAASLSALCAWVLRALGFLKAEPTKSPEQ